MKQAENSPRREAAFMKDWTKGSVINNLLLLSWPMVVMESLWVVSQLVDLIWVGRLGPSSIAGVGIANIALMLVWSVDMGLLVGARAMIARYIGAGDLQGANHVAGQAIILGICWGLLVTLIGIFLAEPILGLFGVDEKVATEGAAYVRIVFAGWVGMEVLTVSLYVIQASGDTVTPMIIEAVIRVVHIALCPFLVLGWWLFPHLGISGAALSNVISQTLGAVIILWVLFRGRTRLHLTLRDFRFALNTIWRILRIGIPALVMSLQSAFGSMILMKLIVPFGTLAVAAHSLASRMEMFLFVPGMALGTGAGVLVGQNLGAGQPERAKRSSWMAVGFVEVFMVVCSAVVLIWAEKITGIFTTEPGLIELGSNFLRIATTSYLVMALSSVLQNCIAGAGDTLPNMIVSIATVWIVQLPLAFFIPKVTNLGIYGVRWAIVAATYAAVIAYVIYFASGRWKTKKI
jgi:putative MATE family efflux protein